MCTKTVIHCQYECPSKKVFITYQLSLAAKIRNSSSVLDRKRNPQQFRFKSEIKPETTIGMSQCGVVYRFNWLGIATNVKILSCIFVQPFTGNDKDIHF